MDIKLCIIGCGNMGRACAEGLLAKKVINAKMLTVTRRNLSLLEDLRAQGATVTSDNLSAAKNADVIIIGVKPWLLTETLREIAPVIGPEKLVISLAAGGSISSIEEELSEGVSVARVIPNTAIAICESMTSIALNTYAKAKQDLLDKLFGSLGKVEFVDEKSLDAAMIIASCGTAFALRFLRAMSEGGVSIGLKPEQACRLAAQTIKGASEILLQKNTHPESEIDKVTTPGGITIAGLNEMESRGFSSSVIQGVKAAYHKTKE